MTIYPKLDTFVRGEISPRLHSRASLELYQAALSECRNFLTLPHGGIRKRGGTRFVGAVADEARNVIGVPFVFSANQSYWLEFGHYTVRVYAYGGYVTEIASPWHSNDLTDLRWAQSGDVLWVVSDSYQPRKITRVTNSSWIIDSVSFQDGPFEASNFDESSLVYASDITGSITLNSDNPIFSENNVGKLFKIEMESYADIKPWEANGKIADGEGRGAIERCRYDGRVYSIVTDIDQSWRFGATPPTHTKGVEPDGPIVFDDSYSDIVGVDLRYVHSGFGVARITGFVNSRQVTASVVSRFPEECVGSENKQYLWAFGAFGPGNWPQSVALFEERLLYSSKLSVYGSKTGNFERFQPGEKDDDGLEFFLSSNEANEIQWMKNVNGFLAVGTIGGVQSLSGAGIDEPLTPSSFKNRSSSTARCGRLPPVKTLNTLIYGDLSLTGASEMAVNAANRFESNDLFQISEHITKKYGAFTSLAYQELPDPVLWFTTAKGYLVGLTYQSDQQVRGVHVHETKGKFKHVTVTPGLGDGDDVWLIVDRVINGVSRRYVELLEHPQEYADISVNWHQLDSLLSYSGAPVSTLTGLSHLEGQKVTVVADQKVYNDITVLNAGISLPSPASQVTVGLPFEASAETLELDVGGRDGSLMARRKRIGNVYLSVMETDLSQLDVSSLIGKRWEPARVYSHAEKVPGDVSTGTLPPIPVSDRWEGNARMKMRHKGPAPCTIRAISFEMDNEP